MFHLTVTLEYTTTFERYNIQLPDYYPAVKTTLEEFYRAIGKRKAVASVPVLLEQFCTIELLRVLEQKLQRYSENSQGVEVGIHVFIFFEFFFVFLSFFEGC